MQKRCFCFLLSVVVLSVTGGMVNAGWWSGALEDIVISDPDDGFSVNPPAVFCGLNGRMFAAWQQLGPFWLYSSTKFSSEVLVTEARDDGYPVYLPEIDYKRQMISFPESFNEDCSDCSIDVAVGPTGEYYAVWSQKVAFGAIAVKRIHFGYCDHESYGGLWSSRIADFIVSDGTVEYDAFSPKIDVGEEGYVYLAWAQKHENNKLNVETCALIPAEEFPGYVMINHEIKEVSSPDEFSGLDIAYHNRHACVVWLDRLERSCIMYSLCNDEGHYYDTDSAYIGEYDDDFGGISIASPPAPSDSSKQNFDDSENSSPELSIFHAVFGREAAAGAHKINHIKAVVNENAIDWEEPQEIAASSFDAGDLNPDLSISDAGILHVAMRGKLSSLQNRECFYIFSTDGGNTWIGSEDEYELISWDDPDHFFNLKDVSICLNRESMPYVVWREVDLMPPLLEVHISAFHE